jgi:hypothetical protein
MNVSILLFTILISIIVLLVVIVNLMLRVRRLENKAADVSPADISAYVDNMREILVESERVSEQLDASIKEKEAMLEDLNDLVESKIKRFQDLSTFEPADSAINKQIGASIAANQGKGLQEDILQMLLNGESINSVATKLGLTITEVERLIDIG